MVDDLYGRLPLNSDIIYRCGTDYKINTIDFLMSYCSWLN